MRNDDEFTDAVAQIRAGTNEAWATLYVLVANKALRWAKEWCQDEDDAVDLIHDTFLALMTKLDQYDDARPFIPWLKSIAYHLWIDKIRHHKPQLLVRIDEEREDTHPHTDDGEAQFLVELRASFNALREHMSPIERDVIDKLIMFDGDAAKAAAAANISKSRIYQIITALKDRAP